MLFFGGLNEQMQPINSLDTFDVTTYRWEKLKTKGKQPEPRHSHCAYVNKDKYYILGGTKSIDLFEIEKGF